MVNLTIAISLALCALILFGTLSPHPVLSSRALGSDKIQHFLGFGSIVAPAGLLRPRLLWFTVPLAVLLGGAVELIQPFVGRDCDIHDFYADCTGIVIAVVATTSLRFVLRRGGKTASTRT
ncbi:VanZ family protein [Acidimangrovimonas sediminis]|uniref:teicoplanin resistance protein VanZ n=1 Tax=Acidimangrovimonas sediminis TaxID=2056283 RepID=UPI0011AFB02C|nr:teicoplanin resistance protein VanZ [Acidimangrovimonas sediminis]